MLENDMDFFCPYCDSPQSIRLDVSGGTRQSFVSDCEVCCQPILIRAEFDADSLVNFSTEKENE